MSDHCEMWLYTFNEWDRRGHVENGFLVAMWQNQWRVGSWSTWWFEVELC
jgi:hypothetical protein